MGKGQNDEKLAVVWKHLIAAIIGSLERFNTSVGEVTASVVCQSNKLMRSCFSWMSKESGFLRWNLLLVKIL